MPKNAISGPYEARNKRYGRFKIGHFSKNPGFASVASDVGLTLKTRLNTLKHPQAKKQKFCRPIRWLEGREKILTQKGKIFGRKKGKNFDQSGGRKKGKNFLTQKGKIFEKGKFLKKGKMT